MPSVPPISSILIKPAGPDCNLACDYCFYRPKAVLYPDGPPVHRMTEAVLEAVVGQYMSLAGPRPVLAWQGGEPTLMGLDFYRAAVEFEQRLGKPGQVVGNGFQTNGVLLDDEWARFFARYKFLVGVSLDGPRELHDLHRRDASGAPTFERVMRGIDALRRGGVEFNVLCMVTRESVGRPEELFEFFLAKDLRHLQFIPLVEPGAEPLTAAEFSVAPEDYGEFLCRLFDLWAGEWPPPLGIRIFDELLSAYAGQPAPSCTFAETCGAYVVVEHNGDVYACDFMVEPRWMLGNLTREPLGELVASATFREFAGRKSDYGEQCRACRWLPMCHGGCQKHRLITSPDVAAASYFCAAYQQLFGHSRRTLRRLADRLR
jgi:uncharacterized protein